MVIVIVLVIVLVNHNRASNSIRNNSINGNRNINSFHIRNSNRGCVSGGELYSYQS